MCAVSAYGEQGHKPNHEASQDKDPPRHIGPVVNPLKNAVQDHPGNGTGNDIGDEYAAHKFCVEQVDNLDDAGPVHPADTNLLNPGLGGVVRRKFFEF